MNKNQTTQNISSDFVALFFDSMRNKATMEIIAPLCWIVIYNVVKSMNEIMLIKLQPICW